MMFLKRIICALFGHKPPTNCHGAIIDFPSTDYNRYRYVHEILPCERCITYNKSSRYTVEQWDEMYPEYAISEYEEDYDVNYTSEMIH